MECGGWKEKEGGGSRRGGEKASYRVGSACDDDDAKSR